MGDFYTHILFINKIINTIIALFYPSIFPSYLESSINLYYYFNIL